VQKAIVKILELMTENVLQERIESARRFDNHAGQSDEEVSHRIAPQLPPKSPMRQRVYHHAIVTGLGLSLPCLWIASNTILSI
jgi:hypothetical protein